MDRKELERILDGVEVVKRQMKELRLVFHQVARDVSTLLVETRRLQREVSDGQGDEQDR